MGCSPPDSSACWILQARKLEWVAISFSQGSLWPRDWTYVSCTACDSLPPKPLGGIVCLPWSTAVEGGVGGDSSQRIFGCFGFIQETLWSRWFLAASPKNSPTAERSDVCGYRGAIGHRKTSKSLQMVTAATKLKDACYLEVKLWQT